MKRTVNIRVFIYAVLSLLFKSHESIGLYQWSFPKQIVVIKVIITLYENCAVHLRF